MSLPFVNDIAGKPFEDIERILPQFRYWYTMREGHAAIVTNDLVEAWMGGADGPHSWCRPIDWKEDVPPPIEWQVIDSSRLFEDGPLPRCDLYPYVKDHLKLNLTAFTTSGGLREYHARNVAMVQGLLPHWDHWYVVREDGQRGYVHAKDMFAWVGELGAGCWPVVSQADETPLPWRTFLQSTSKHEVGRVIHVQGKQYVTLNDFRTTELL